MTERIPLAACIALAAALSAACASSERKPPSPALIEQADKTIGTGVASYNQSDYARAEEHFIKAFYRYRGIDNPEGIAASCINLARTRLSRGDLASAREWADSAQRLITEASLHHLQNHVIIVQSSIAIESRDHAAAKQLLAPLLDDADLSPDRPTRLAALQNRTRLAFTESDAASTWVERYAALVTTADEPLHQARLERFRAQLANNEETARRHFDNALAIYRGLAHRPGIAATLTERARLETGLEAYEIAAGLLERALYIRAEMMDPHKSREVLELYARIFSETGDTDALRSTRQWIERTRGADFSNWRQLTEAYSSYPGIPLR